MYVLRSAELGQFSPEEYMAAQEISSIPSHDSEERDRGSDTLTVSPVVLQNHVKLLHEYQQLVISVFGIFFTSQAGLTYGGIARFKSTTPIELAGLSVLFFFLGLDLGLPYYTRNIFVDLETYIRTVAVVLEAYALLLLISTRYIRIAIIPVIILVFVGALCSKFRENRSIQYDHRREVTLQNCAKSAEKLMKMAMIPYCLQLSFVIWTQLKGQEGGIFIHSHFLLFFSSTLGALAVMVATPPVVVSPGVVQVLPVLHKTCIVMLLITIHTMAAEWLGEDIIMVCMPELIAVLVWFTIRFDHAGHGVSVNSITLLKSAGIIRSSVVVAILAYLTTIYANDRKILASWYRRALWISIPSSALSYFDVWMLHQWPGSTSDSKGPFELLKFCSKICLCMTALLLCMMSVRWVLDEDDAIPVYISLAVLLFLVGWQLKYWVIAVKRQKRRPGTEAVKRQKRRPGTEGPGSTSDSKGPIELLKFSSIICLCMTALQCMMSVRWVLDEDEAIPVYYICLAVLLFLVGWQLKDWVIAVKRQKRRPGTEGPGSTSDSKGPIELLKLSSIICFFIASILCHVAITLQNRYKQLYVIISNRW